MTLKLLRLLSKLLVYSLSNFEKWLKNGTWYCRAVYIKNSYVCQGETRAAQMWNWVGGADGSAVGLYPLRAVPSYVSGDMTWSGVNQGINISAVCNGLIGSWTQVLIFFFLISSCLGAQSSCVFSMNWWN